MSKSIGKIMGTGSTKKYGYEGNYLNYLSNYDTSNYDNTVNNLSSYAFNLSNNLNALPDYQLNVSASDDARQRAENATYQAYIDKLTPQFNQQIEDTATYLTNRGLTVGSEAYQRAMNDVYQKQNEALNQASYSSVLNGQSAYNDSLKNDIYAAQFNNSAQQNYINMVKSLLDGSVSGYQSQNDLYNAQNGIQTRQDQSRQQRFNTLSNLGGKAIGMFF